MSRDECRIILIAVMNLESSLMAHSQSMSDIIISPSTRNSGHLKLLPRALLDGFGRFELFFNNANLILSRIHYASNEAYSVAGDIQFGFSKTLWSIRGILKFNDPLVVIKVIAVYP